MARSSPFFFSFLFCSLFLSHGGFADGSDLGFSQVRVESLIPSDRCSPTSARNGSSLRLVNRNGPCSGKPLGKKNHIAALAYDSLRVASIQATAAGTSFENDSVILGSQVSIPARSGLYIGSGNYVVSVAFGTPARTQTVIFDTGSDLNWIQCRPCEVSCYPQQEPLFTSTLSSTYRSVGCTAPACVGLPRRGCSRGTCVYGVTYGDGSFTNGFLATETFRLTPTIVFNNFIFGCGQNNQGLFRGAAGLIGLGRSSYSLNSQAASRLGNVFSYCLPSTSSAAGYLNIGNPLRSSVVYTPMLTDSRAPSLYFIDLIGISVGGTRLALSPTVFRSPGTIIDSGTVITRLPPAAYNALRTAFRAAMTRYTRAPAASILDTCYDFSRVSSVTYPQVKLHYTGVDVTLPGVGVFYTISLSQVCLAFAGNSASTDIGIIGNVQQKTFEVTYNNAVRRIGFAAGACS